jgi:hypothetical protein
MMDRTHLARKKSKLTEEEKRKAVYRLPGAQPRHLAPNLEVIRSLMPWMTMRGKGSAKMEVAAMIWIGPPCVVRHLKM